MGFASVTGYMIYWNSTGTSQLRITINNGAITSYSEAGVVQGQAYAF